MFFQETISEPTCNAVSLDIENGYGLASVDQCLTQDPRRRWAINCSVTFECLSGYQLEGNKTFVCDNGKWAPDEAKPSCKYRFLSCNSNAFSINICSYHLNIKLIYLWFQV